MDLSVIIPARNEKYLQRTIEDVLANIEADTEIIAICDGYWPSPSIKDHPRVNLIHHSEARGQRQGINAAARIAQGKFIFKLDAHCAVGPGFDRILIEDWQPGWTMVPRMYNLDVDTWEPKLHKRTDYMYIGFNDKDELRALYYTGNEWHEWHKREAEIDETMCCMGPGWFLSADDFWRQGGCDETHGSWGQQGIEVALKAWLSGGALMVDKRTWFAHWFRGHLGWPYPISGRAVAAARDYSKDLWLNDKWEGQTRPLSWLIEKFDPPGWGWKMKKQFELNAALYQHIHRESREPRWRGIQVIKMPTDLFLYSEIIQRHKPKFIVETGTKFGGSSLWFQDVLDTVGEGGRVITIDIDHDQVKERDPRITYVTGSSIDRDIVEQVKGMVDGAPAMMVLDSNHHRRHVKWELWHYAELVTPGQYLVIEDCYTRSTKLYGPGEARDWFLRTEKGKAFEQTHLDRRFLVGVCLGGWLRRKA